MQSGVRRCADGPRLDGAVSAIKLVLVVLPESHRPNAKRVTRTTMHPKTAFQLTQHSA
jgi:hypothetical protein